MAESANADNVVTATENHANGKPSKADDFLGTAGKFMSLAGSITVSGMDVVRTSWHLAKY